MHLSIADYNSAKRGRRGGSLVNVLVASRVPAPECKHGTNGNIRRLWLRSVRIRLGQERISPPLGAEDEER